MIFKIIGAVIAIFGLILPSLMGYGKSERWKSGKNFAISLLLLIAGIAIAGVGVWIFQMGD